MIFGKHINRYYLRYSPVILLGVLSLVLVDYMQLEIPKLYGMVINGIKDGFVTLDGVSYAFDMTFLLDKICLPLIFIIAGMVVGRFLWRICFFGSGIRLETDLRGRMFARCEELSREYYQVNKVGNLMSFFTNDLETVQDCFGSGILMFFDAILLGSMSLIEMAKMDPTLTLLSMIPMAFLIICSLVT